MVGHGTSWTLLASALTACTPDPNTWSAMTMPDHCSIEIKQGAVVSPWGAWRVP